MALYEHVFLTRQDAAPTQVDALTEQYKALIAANGGKVTKTEYWGLKSLTYRIKKNRKAHYVMLEIDAPAGVVAELERQTQINEDVIRYMTVKVEELEAGQSVMMRKQDRDKAKRREHILVLRRPRPTRREPVIHRDDRQFQNPRNLAADAFVAIDATRSETSAVVIDHNRRGHRHAPRIEQAQRRAPDQAPAAGTGEFTGRRPMGVAAMLVMDMAVIVAVVVTAVKSAVPAVPTVVAVSVTGNAHIPTDRILSVLTTKVGDPFDQQTVLGPVISESAINRMLGMIQRGVADGGRIVAGGERLGGEHGDGYYLPITLLADVPHDCEIAQNEVFGPVLVVTPFDTEDEAIALANGTDYGLGAYVHTQNLRRAHHVTSQLQAGMIHVNGGGEAMQPNCPFGGWKQSGHGRLGGVEGLQEFLQPKNIWMSLAAPEG